MNDGTSLEMSAFAAHLDHGWDLLQRGELAAARLSATEVMSLDPESAEGLTLLGAIAVAEGEAEEALEHFQQAMDLDPDYLEPLLHAAEVAIHPLQDLEYALQLCDDAEPLAGSDEEILDVRLLRAEALVAAGDLGRGARAVDQLPPPPYPGGGYALRVGRVLLELGRSAPALELLGAALEEATDAGEARYLLGVAHEQEARWSEALVHFFALRTLDRAAPVPPWTISPAELLRLAGEARAQLPEALPPEAREVPLLVLDYPSLEVIAEGFDPRGMVCFSGQPAPPAAPDDGAAASPPAVHLSCIFVYQLNVERYRRTGAEIAEELAEALRREAALFFGLPTEE